MALHPYPFPYICQHGYDDQGNGGGCNKPNHGLISVVVEYGIERDEHCRFLVWGKKPQRQ